MYELLIVQNTVVPAYSQEEGQKNNNSKRKENHCSHAENDTGKQI